jgi:transposase
MFDPSPRCSPSARANDSRSGSTPSARTTLPSLHTLAAGIDRDRDAVIAGLTLPWSSGVVEGHVNRIKMLKRQMFGRAGFALLRKRVLLAE